MEQKHLTVEEVEKAASIFFPLLDVISSRLPENATIEDKLKVMESVCTLAQKLRAEEEKTNFGFNKNGNEETN